LHENTNSDPAIKEQIGDNYDEYMREYLETSNLGDYDAVPTVPVYNYRGRSSNNHQYKILINK
jgi:hypothetical protein